MGLLSSRVSITRYKVEGELQAPVVESVANILKENAIVDIDEGDTEKRVGWTSFDNPFRPVFENSSFVVGPYLIFSLRIDKKTIPPKIIKKQYETEMANRLAESGRNYLARDEKKLIKEEVTRILAIRIPATPHVYDLIWNYEASLVWFFSTLASANTELEELFFHSFNLPLIRLFPYTMADLLPGLSDKERDVLATLSPTDFME
ncbi:MAG: recombination-associated protein RdgC [Deltaproteobacteria bacterium]|nr:recombination-associated protein RdgC [Deltaproteobacteria bacterium]